MLLQRNPDNDVVDEEVHTGMDTQKFDGLTRSLATSGRRGVLKALAGAAMGAVGLAGLAALGAEAQVESQARICYQRGQRCRGSTDFERNRSCCSRCCRKGYCQLSRAC
jgi:hypothetical protein